MKCLQTFALSRIIDFQWKHWYSMKSPKLAKEKLMLSYIQDDVCSTHLSSCPMIVSTKTCSKRIPRTNCRWNMFQRHKKCFTLRLLQFEGEKKLSKMRISKLFLKTLMLRELCSKLHEQSWKGDVRDMRIAKSVLKIFYT